MIHIDCTVVFTEEEVKVFCQIYKKDFTEVKRWYDGLKSSIVEMLSGTTVEVDVASFQNNIFSIANKDDVLTYLIHMSYLAYASDSKMAFVPNEEIRQELIRATRRKKWNEKIRNMNV